MMTSDKILHYIHMDDTPNQFMKIDNFKATINKGLTILCNQSLGEFRNLFPHGKMEATGHYGIQLRGRPLL